MDLWEFGKTQILEKKRKEKEEKRKLG